MNFFIENLQKNLLDQIVMINMKSYFHFIILIKARINSPTALELKFEKLENDTATLSQFTINNKNLIKFHQFDKFIKNMSYYNSPTTNVGTLQLIIYKKLI